MVRLLALGLILVAACSSSSSSSSDAVTKCTNLIDALCTRFAQCEPDAGVSAASCESQSGTSLNCAQVRGVSTGYDGCLADVQQGSCSTLFTSAGDAGTAQYQLPPSCVGALQR